MFTNVLEFTNVKKCSDIHWYSPIFNISNVQVVTDSSSDSPLLRSSRSSRPRTVYLDTVTIASLTSLNPRTNYLVKTKPRLLLTFLNIKYFITFHFSPHLHKNGNRFYFRREALRGRGDSAELSAWAKASTGVAHLQQPAPVHCNAPPPALFYTCSNLVATCLPHSLPQVGWSGRRSRWRDTHWTAKLPSFKV